MWPILFNLYGEWLTREAMEGGGSINKIKKCRSPGIVRKVERNTATHVGQAKATSMEKR